MFGYKERSQNKNPCFNDKLSITNIHISATVPANRIYIIFIDTEANRDVQMQVLALIYPRSKLLHVHDRVIPSPLKPPPLPRKAAQKSPSLSLSLPAQADYTTRKSSFMLS